MPTEETEEAVRLLPLGHAVAGARVETQARHDDGDDIRGFQAIRVMAVDAADAWRAERDDMAAAEEPL